MAYHDNYPTSPVSAIPWSHITHITQFGYVPNADGTLTDNTAGDTVALIQAAHSNGTKVLAGVIQLSGRGGDFGGAIDNHLASLVLNIVNVVNTYGYDGVDLDWEPTPTGASLTKLVSLIEILRAALGPRLISVDVAVWPTQWNAANTANVDRLNVMTYDMDETSGPWSWFNSALLWVNSNDGVFSVQLVLFRFTGNGVPAAKINVGIPFYGRTSVGGGITGPRQAWGTTLPTLTPIFYKDILSKYNVSKPNVDSATGGAPWITVPNGWLYYDSPAFIATKVQYVLDNHLGGFTMLSLDSDYIATGATPLLKHPLVAATGVGLGTKVHGKCGGTR